MNSVGFNLLHLCRCDKDKHKLQPCFENANSNKLPTNIFL